MLTRGLYYVQGAVLLGLHHVHVPWLAVYIMFMLMLLGVFTLCLAFQVLEVREVYSKYAFTARSEHARCCLQTTRHALGPNLGDEPL